MAKDLFDLFGSNTVGAAQAEPIPAAITPEKSIFDEAVLLSLELRVFGTSKKLADAEYQVDASKEKTRATKGILRSDELRAIGTFDGETRRIVNLYTLPSKFRAGLYVLPLASIEEVDRIMRERQETRNNLIDVFCGAYETLRYRDSLPAEQGGLGAVYHECDYPDVSRVRAAFGMSYSYTEFSAPGRLRGISMAIYEREKAKAAECWRSAIEEGQALLRGAFASLIEHMSERLTPGSDGKPKSFKNSLVKNVIDFLGTFDARNLAGDVDLAKLVRQAADMLSGVAPEDLRKSETVRASVAAGVEKIKAQLSGMVTIAGPRKIALDDQWEDI